MKTFNKILFLMGLSVFIVIFSGCGGAKTDGDKYTLEENPPFTVGDVFYQDWVAGVQGGGSGTNVHITFESFSETVEVKEIFFRKKIASAQISPQIRNRYVGYFKNEIKPNVIMDIDPMKEAQNTPPRIFPFDLADNEAVVSYLHNDSIRYAKISNIRMEELLGYPSVKPNDDN